jgi:hypothetical protein
MCSFFNQFTLLFTYFTFKLFTVFVWNNNKNKASIMVGTVCANVMPISLWLKSGSHQIVWGMKIFLYTVKASEDGKRLQYKVERHNYKLHVKRSAWYA